MAEWVEKMLERYRTMKNSLFKRVAAAAAAVPLALTQCLAFSSVAADNDAVQNVGNTLMAGNQAVTLDKLLYIPANETVSTWNLTAASSLAELKGTSGTINKDRILELVKYVPDTYQEAVTAALEEYILINPVTYEITDSKDIILKGTVSQPNFNGNWKNTPGQALSELARGYNAPALNKVDFSSVHCSGDVIITIKTSELDGSTTVPVQAVYATTDGEKIYPGTFAAYCERKLAEVEEVGKAAIAKEVAADKVAEATEKFLAKTDLIREKLQKAGNALDNAFTKSADYKSVSEALTAANNFLAKKNIKKQIPTTATEIAALEKVKNYYDKAVAKASSKADIQITADELGQFVDSITSKSLEDKLTSESLKAAYADKEVATAFDINVNNGKGVFVGAFDDAESEAVKAWVESEGYQYLGSYKKLTGTVDFTGYKTADTGSVDVQIERILVTDTTTTTTETSPVSTATPSVTETSPVSTGTPSVTETSPVSTGTPSVTETSPVSTGTPSVTETSPVSTGTPSVTETSPVSTGTPSVTETSPVSTGTPSVTETSPVSTGTSPVSSQTAPVSVPADVTTTSAVAAVYVELDSTYGFYMNIEDSFDTNQIKSAKLHTIYDIGYTQDDVKYTVSTFEDVIDITDKIGFGNATPGNTYKPVENKFDYDVQLVYTGEAVKDKEGNQVLASNSLLRDQEGNIATVVVYIGLKGDTTLNNLVDGRDATATLTYYSKISTEGNDATNTYLSPSELVNGNAGSVYDDFAAFLSDVKFDNNEKMDRFAKKSERLVDGRDASSILTYYAKASTVEYSDMAENTPAQLWDIVTGSQDE
jgi:predicted  nucleic acid-binding Zn-ribbon protein